MKKIYPFKFLDAYEKEDKFIFFGRDEEINELYEMVFQSSVILLYGASGTGKTSLINCGLAGKFQPHDWFPLMVRRGNDINDSLEKALKDAGGDFSGATNDINWDDEFTYGTSETETILSPVGSAIRSIYLNSFRPIYLIFDQFEELFILGSSTEQDQFINSIKDILGSHQPVKIIFSIREEYLGHLFDFEQEVPQLMDRKLRIEPMNLVKVKQVIVGATRFEGSIISLKDGEADEIASGIFEKIKGKQKSLTIQLPFLQVFLDKFYRQISGDPKHLKETQFSVQALNEMSDIGDILINFLEDQVGEIEKNLKPKYPNIDSEMIWKILSPLSTLEGTKEPIRKEDLYGRLTGLDHDIIDDTIEAFIKTRIIRFNENSQLYEISHDALAKPISEKRSVEEKTLLEIRRMINSQVNVKKEAREFFTERQIHFIEPYLGKINLSQEENELLGASRKYISKAKRKRKLRIVGSFAILIVAVIVMSVMSYSNFRAKERIASTYKSLIIEQKASAEKSKTLEVQTSKLEEQTEKLKAQTDQLKAQTDRLTMSEEGLKKALQRSEFAIRTASIAQENLKEAEKRSDTVRNEMRKIAIKGKQAVDLFTNKEREMNYYLREDPSRELYEINKGILENIDVYYGEALGPLIKDINNYANKLKKLTRYQDSRNNLWGYKDSEGNIAIFPIYVEAKEFNDNDTITNVKFPGNDVNYQINKEGIVVSLEENDETFIWESSGIGKKKPKDMFVGGYKVENNDTINYCVCRSKWQEGIHSGRLEEDDKCHFGWGGAEQVVDDYEILIMGSKSFDYKWVAPNEVSTYQEIGWTKYIGGWNDNYGNLLYIGQSEYEGQLIPGKIWMKWNHIAYDTKEIPLENFNVLMVKATYEYKTSK